MNLIRRKTKYFLMRIIRIVAHKFEVLGLFHDDGVDDDDDDGDVYLPYLLCAPL